MLSLACLLVIALPQGEVHGRPPRIVIPKTGTERQQDPRREIPRDGLQKEFSRRIQELRRSRFLDASKESAEIRKLGDDFEDVAARAVQMLARAEADELYGLMKVLQRYGDESAARELEYQLLTRRLGTATGIVVETMATLARDESRKRLLTCLASSRASVRSHAAKALETRLTSADTEPLLILSREQKLDVQLKALRLLGHVAPSAEIRLRLLQALGERPPVAFAAVEALVQHGPSAAGDLKELLARPATGRNFGYAALALVWMEQRSPGVRLISEEMAQQLRNELDVPDPFQQTAVALALAGLAWASDDVSGEVYRDREIVDRLIAAVAPTEFIDHLAIVQELSHERLAKFVGQDFGRSRVAWSEWWKAAGKVGSFVGGRQRVAVTEQNAELALLTWRRGESGLRIRGVNAAEPEADDAMLDIILSGDEMLALVRDLENSGFMSPTRLDEMRTNRSLRLSVGGALVRTDPRTASYVLDRMQVRLEKALSGNEWQLYRDPQREPDAEAFWRSERRWLAQNEDATARATRLKDRIVGLIGQLRGERFQSALGHLAGIPELPSLLVEADGVKLAESVRDHKEWGEPEFGVLELALLAPGDVWQRTLAVAESRDDEGGGTRALARIFALLGPERLIASITTGSHRVRLAAMDESARLGDLRATEPLRSVAINAEESTELRRTAIYALGQMRAIDASDTLLAMSEDPGVDATLRRTSWIALARIGVPEVFGVLQRAFPSPVEGDRTAVVRALGEIRHPLAARQLADIYALRGRDRLGLLAYENLRRHGDLLASPALEKHLEHPDAGIRSSIALLLGEFQSPAALPELMAMLTAGEDRLRVVSLVAGITGIDFAAVNDRSARLRSWYTTNRQHDQAKWFLDALAAEEIGHSIKPEQLGRGAGTATVPELIRLVLELEQPYLRALAGRMLRVNTGEDYGVISPLLPEERLVAICDRYKLLYDSDKAASGR